MKTTKRFLYFAAVSSLLFAACSREDVVPEENLTPGENTGETYPVYFGAEATLNDADITAGTKVSLTPDADDSSFKASWDYLDTGSIQYSCNDDNFYLTDTFKDATWNGSSFTVYFAFEHIEKESNWKYTFIYPHQSKLTSGQNRVQEGSKYNSEYDLMIGNASVTSALPGKDDEGNPIVFNMVRETGIAYFHIKSNLGEDETLVSATLTVDGGTIASEKVSLKSKTNFSQGFEYSGDEYNSINLTFKEGTAPSANDFKLWFNVLPTDYNSSTLEIKTTAHTLTLTKNAGTYNYEINKLYKVTGTVSDDKWDAFPNAITVETVEGGTLSANCSEAEIGTTVTLTATANEDYYFNNKWSVTGKNGNPVEVTGNTFIMPAYPVTVTGTFTKQSGGDDNRTNLSADGKIANCYIVPPTADLKYKFQTNNINGLVGDVTSCEVLWESFGTSIVTNLGDLVKEVFYSDGYISFTTTGNAGNALIAAKDAKGVILWSWHIWLTETPVDQQYTETGYMMDRNLGATSAGPGKTGTVGLWYQWGRKDPFMAPQEVGSTTMAMSTISKWTSQTDQITIDESIKSPTLLVYNYEWAKDGTNYRWGDGKNKTIYDPCPAGYYIPAKTFFPDISGTDDKTNLGISFTPTSGTTVWYPYAGARKAGASGATEYTGERGYIWSSNSATYMRMVSGQNMNFSRLNNNGLYANVRCQKQ